MKCSGIKTNMRHEIMRQAPAGGEADSRRQIWRRRRGAKLINRCDVRLKCRACKRGEAIEIKILAFEISAASAH